MRALLLGLLWWGVCWVLIAALLFLAGALLGAG